MYICKLALYTTGKGGAGEKSPVKLGGAHGIKKEIIFFLRTMGEEWGGEEKRGK